MLTHTKNTAFFALLYLLLLLFHFFIFPVPSIFFVLIIAVYFGILAWGSAAINSNYHLHTICAATQNKHNEIAFSFDDGPDAAITPLVLDILKREDIKATFFCIGKKIQGNESILNRLSTEGHTIGNHTFSHSTLIDFYREKTLKKELAETNQLIEKITKQKVIFFRPPYGVTTPALAAAVKNLNLTTIGWNIRSFDTQKNSPQKIAKRVCAQIKPGSILLFHDTNTRITSVLEETIAFCKKNGFKIVSLEKLIYQPTNA